MSNYKLSKFPRVSCKKQRGVSLVELMIGVAIGLVIVGAALATLVMSRTLSGTVTDVSQLQQQASYALFILGERISSTGSLRFDRVAASPYYVFDNTSPSYAGAAGLGAKISGTEGTTDTVTTGMQAYASGVGLDCLGATLPPTATRNDATFYVLNKALFCRPNHGGVILTPQQIITNVEEFKVRYGVRTGPRDANLQYFTANQIATPAAWNRVALAEVCLHLKGEEGNQPVITNTFYTDCNGANQPRDRFLRLVVTRSFYTANSGL